ncbi:MAG: type IV pilus assembly protein PilM [Patescibacteria group bacterium]|jgi:type IV pilus assembly protein PilM|nr:type IV pilus assembly protein PilM [Patescibacteria group bacterium]
MGLFSNKQNDYFLGIDIGDSSLKMVELKKRKKQIYLSNYAFSENVSEVNFTKIEDVNYLAKAINKVRFDAGITSEKAIVSLPTFSVFSSIINVNSLGKKNLSLAVAEEAKKVIPLPMDEMTIDWRVIPDENGKIPSKGNMRVFLTGSPKKLVRRYVDIFKAAKLSLLSLETETFSLIRSLVGNDKSTVMIVEIGANSTDISIVKESVPVLNRSLGVCSSTITKALSEQMGLTYVQAEQFKVDLTSAQRDREEGKENEKQEDLPPLIAKTIEPIITEIKYMLEFFSTHNTESVEKVILSGGGALLAGLPEHLTKELDLRVLIGDPFARIRYPQELEPVLENVGPKLAVAIGLAMREMK